MTSRKITEASQELERVRREQKWLNEEEKRENQRLGREIDKQEKRKGIQVEEGKREEKQNFQKQKTGTDDSEKTDSILTKPGSALTTSCESQESGTEIAKEKR